MYKTRTHIICTGLALLFSSAAICAKEGERHISLQQDVSSAETIRVHVPAGDVDIVGITGNDLVAEVTAVCNDQDRQACLELLQDLDWAKKAGSTTEFLLTPDSITNFNNVTIKVKIGVPRDKKLAASLSAGELSIQDTNACLTAELNAGEIDIALQENQLASAMLNATVGDVKLISARGEQTSGKRSLLVGANLEWQQGKGNCHTKANVMAGEVKLTLK